MSSPSRGSTMWPYTRRWDSSALSTVPRAPEPYAASARTGSDTAGCADSGLDSADCEGSGSEDSGCPCSGRERPGRKAASAIPTAAGPLILTIPIAPAPVAVERATIVSSLQVGSAPPAGRAVGAAPGTDSGGDSDDADDDVRAICRLSCSMGGAG